MTLVTPEMAYSWCVRFTVVLNSAFIMVRFLLFSPIFPFINALKTPNFAMGTNHVPQSPRQTISSSRRLTLQHFAKVNSDLVSIYAPNNQDARPPASEDWFSYPPPIILDALYGNAVLRRYATKSILDLINDLTKNNYYLQKTLDEETTMKKQLWLKQIILLSK